MCEINVEKILSHMESYALLDIPILIHTYSNPLNKDY